MRVGAVDELLERLVRLLVIDQEQDWIRDQTRERNEIGAGGFDRTAEQFVNLGVSGDPGVVRQQSVSVRLGGGYDLRADLSGGTGLGFNHDWLLEDRLHGRGQ